MKRAFTLIEMLISITILSIMMIFLYESYSSLNISNNILKKEVTSLKKYQIKKKVFFLDFVNNIENKITILDKADKNDVVFLQSSNSIHKRINPYIAYFVNDSKLYRLESIKEFVKYPIGFDHEFSAECFGDVESFKVYKSTKEKTSYLLHVKFKNSENILLRL